jgi:hypothetical protein
MDKPKPIDVEQIDLDRLREKTTNLPGLIEYAHSVGGFAIVPTKEGNIKASAMQAMQEQTQIQLDMIMEQMKVLAKQAQELKDRADISSLIYEAKMSFKPVIGKLYHLYETKETTHLLSLLSPADWGERCPYPHFLASVKLLADHTWQVVEKSERFN